LEPNVPLELGLPEGLGNNYCILVNRKQSKDVPSDIREIRRIEYSSLESRETDGLLPNLARYLVRDQTHPRHIWNKLSGAHRDKKFYLSLAILAHFRDNERLSHADIARLSKGLYLREDAQKEVLHILEEHKLVSAIGSRLGAKLAKRIYPKVLELAEC
jgi:hypothetical protein